MVISVLVVKNCSNGPTNQSVMQDKNIADGITVIKCWDVLFNLTVTLKFQSSVTK